MIRLSVFKKLTRSRKFLFLLTVAVTIVTVFSWRQLYSPRATINQPDSNFKAIITKEDFEAFSIFTNKFGPAQTYQFLKQEFTHNETKAHDFAHVIGIVAHDQEGIEGLKICDTAYNYGCYHGFIEAFIAKNGIGKVTVIEEGCTRLGTVHAPSCLHGIGHGVMVADSYNLEGALNHCSLLKNSSQIYCWDGVFMERIVASMQTAKDKPILSEQTLREPCETIAKVFKNQCWRNQIAAWMQFFAGNTRKVGEQCSLLEADYRPTCLESLGLMSTITVGENPDRLISSCRVATANQLSDDCLIGAMKELLFEGKNPNLAYSLCQYVSAENQGKCLATYNDHFNQYQQRFKKRG